MPVRPLCGGCLPWVALRFAGVGAGFGGAAPYFSNSCCVVLYLVAALSFSIAASRCLFRSFRYRWVFDIR